MKNNISVEVGEIINPSVDKVSDAVTNEADQTVFFGTDVSTDWKPGSMITFYGRIAK